MTHSKRRGERADTEGRGEAFWRRLGRDDRLPIDPDLSPEDPSEPSRTHRPATAVIHRRDPRILVAIGAGGFIGTIGRYGVGLAWPTPVGGFPSSTFVINTSGAFALGLTLTWILERLAPSRFLRPFICAGVLGAWTTMSTLAIEADVLLKDGRLAPALLYLGATVLAGAAATAVGIAIGRLGVKSA